MNHISELHQQFPYYGYRKIHWCLMHQYGYNLNIKKAQRLIQEIGIRAIFPGPKTLICQQFFGQMLTHIFVYFHNQLVINNH